MRESWSLRNDVIPLPGPQDGYARVLLVGTTGAGKTTVIRQLIGTDPERERFPSTSAAKTTTAEYEIVMAGGPFQAAVTFLSKSAVRTSIEESVVAASVACLEGHPQGVIAQKLLAHKEQRFRLSYLLGAFAADAQDAWILVDEDDVNEEERLEVAEVSPDERRVLLQRLDQYLSRIHDLTAEIKSGLESELDVPLVSVSKRDRDAFEGLFEEHLTESPGLTSLVDSILEDVESRFALLEDGRTQFGEDNWPTMWTFQSHDRAAFIRRMNRLSSNYAPNFGRLLTPLVQGIRVRGPFEPTWLSDPSDAPRLVLMDGEGLGHTLDSAASLPITVTDRFRIADCIMLVDNAAQPMQAAPATVLRGVLSSGYAPKLIVCFTHFDAVTGDGLPDVQSRRSHVFGSLENAVTTISKELEYLQTQVDRGLVAQLRERTFYLSRIQTELKAGAHATRAELKAMVTTIMASIVPPEPIVATPVYHESALWPHLRDAVRQFRDPWLARLGLTSYEEYHAEHWTRVKALTRRPAEFGTAEYDTLRPVSDLIKQLSEHIGRYLAHPRAWRPPYAPEEAHQVAIDRIAREIHAALHDLAWQRLIADQISAWQQAYQLRGSGSAHLRAERIEEIFTGAAPYFGDAEHERDYQFIHVVLGPVREAIEAAGGTMEQSLSMPVARRQIS